MHKSFKTHANSNIRKLAHMWMPIYNWWYFWYWRNRIVFARYVTLWKLGSNGCNLFYKNTKVWERRAVFKLSFEPFCIYWVADIHTIHVYYQCQMLHATDMWSQFTSVLLPDHIGAAFIAAIFLVLEIEETEVCSQNMSHIFFTRKNTCSYRDTPIF